MDAHDHKMFPHQNGQQSNLNSNSKNDNNGIEYRGDGMDVDQELYEILYNKFALFKTLIMKHVHLKNPAMKLNKHEATRLIEYAKDSYFKHLRLYEFVFNNKAPNEVKRINFIEEQARNEQPLSAAL